MNVLVVLPPLRAVGARLHVTRWLGYAARPLLVVVAWYVARFLGLVAARPQHARPYFAAAVLLPAVLLGLTRPRQVMVAVIGVLPFLGLIRRLLSVTTDPSRDPVLLVAPLAVGVLLVAAIRNGALSRLTALANCVLALCLVIVLGAFNPLQGGLLVGLSGLLFTLVPILWFWVGRAFLTDELFRRIIVIIAVVGVVVGAYGLFQTYVGFPSWDERWIAEYGYSSLSVYGTTRAFSSFVAASEYGAFLAICVALWILLIPRFQTVAIVIAAFLGWALFLESIRGAVFGLFLTLGAITAIRLKLRVVGAVALGGAAMVLVSFAASQFDTGPSERGSKTGNLVRHQLEGLANPFDNETSTADEHASLLFGGLGSVGRYPLGVGSGGATIAASAFGGEDNTFVSTEVDPSNVAVAWGIPGLLVFTAVVSVGLFTAYGVAQRERGLLAFAALVFLTSTIFGWLSGGNYAVAPLPWLALGWVDRHRMSTDDGA